MYANKAAAFRFHVVFHWLIDFVINNWSNTAFLPIRWQNSFQCSCFHSRLNVDCCYCFVVCININWLMTENITLVYKWVVLQTCLWAVKECTLLHNSFTEARILSRAVLGSNPGLMRLCLLALRLWYFSTLISIKLEFVIYFHIITLIFTSHDW